VAPVNAPVDTPQVLPVYAPEAQGDSPSGAAVEAGLVVPASTFTAETEPDTSIAADTGLFFRQNRSETECAKIVHSALYIRLKVLGKICVMVLLCHTKRVW
jgi:hypothetical protein